ncbi:PD-(D/E)XK nuclease family protein [Phycicoccus sp. SLBN-51]|uniref:RecB family exonuclease n=1 Tax=Phycicoccus sp. SLBN-51 TaxID=2768447 RepID=UPI001169BAB8|nr:PD-(D/E)XK nuclease family protein [Phycicoccus sp. SLBN-51]TQJ49741.1 PD-(D/E)XK nuclease superfamily protein [Phycicoccus sp. SLBN-51]
MTVGVQRFDQQEFGGMPQRLFRASPSRLLAWMDCPRRYRLQYLDRPGPRARPQRAHTSVGVAVHNALRDWWDLAPEQRTAAAGAELVRTSWIELGFRDPDQSQRWRARAQQQVTTYLQDLDPHRQPLGIERTVSLKTERLALQGRIDRLDERDGELVVVDYKTSRVAPTDDEPRTSLPLALYAAATWKMFRRRCVRVELHHLPTGTVAAHEHTGESLKRKIDEAESIARDAQRAEADYAEVGVDSGRFPANVTPLCQWCDFRAHCPAGQAAGPEKSDWAALDGEEP